MNNWSTILNNAKTSADIVAILRNVLAQLDSKSFTQIEELFQQTDLTAQEKMNALQQIVFDAQANTTQQLTEFNAFLNEAINSGLVGAGSIDSLVALASGRTQRDKNGDIANVLDYFTITERTAYILNPTTYDAKVPLQRALDATATNKQQLNAYGSFKTTGTLVIKGDINFGQADFNVTGTNLAFDIRTADYSLLFRANIILPRNTICTDKPSAGWVSGSVGVRATNLDTCGVKTGRISGFQTNFILSSKNSKGTVHNKIFIDHLDNGQINQLLTTEDSGSWVNENLFIGGKFSHQTAEGSNVAGTRHIKLDTCVNSVNNNVWIKPSIEGNTAEYHLENGGSYNYFLSARWEAATPKVLYTCNDSLSGAANRGTLNVIDHGYGVDNIVISYSGTVSGFRNELNGYSKRIFNISSSIGGHLYRNTSSGNNAVIAIFDSPDKPETSSINQACIQFAAKKITGKRSTDTDSRILIDTQNGRTYYGDGTGAPSGYIGFIPSLNALTVGGGTNFIPSSDNTVSIGSASLRWSTIYAGTGTINTSDARLKQQWRTQSEAEKAAALEIKANIGLYRFNDAVDLKADGARWHVGVNAQHVVSIMQSHGLDPFDYGFVCYDAWDEQAEIVEQHDAMPQVIDDFGNLLQSEKEAWTEIIQEYRAAGDRYGIRYDELAMFIIASI